MEKLRSVGECLVGMALVAAAIVLGYGACGQLAHSAMTYAALN